MTSGYGPKVKVSNELTDINNELTFSGSIFTKDYENFAVAYTTFNTNGVSASHWRIYAEQDDLYYSTKKTNDIAELLPLSSIN